jgi:DNA-binding XRE family transcriptional regulator
MLEPTKKRRTDVVEVRFVGTAENIRQLRELAHQAGVTDLTESVPWRDAFPEFKNNVYGTLLSGYRHREGMTQEALSRMTGIPRRHISEMENGKRPIEKETAKKFAIALRVDYRSFFI